MLKDITPFQMAQISGLFALRTHSPSIDDLLQLFKAHRGSQGRVPDDDVMWKAWARTESVKRYALIEYQPSKIIGNKAEEQC